MRGRSRVDKNNQKEKKMATNEDLRFMRRAMELALRGEGAVNPNPLVGAVIVRNGRIIGAGWHEQWGGLHAERNALARCSEPASGATMYVTLEPCCHHGKTPPCTEAVIAAGIRRVVVGLTDPNPLVAGKGIEKLREAGIEVESGVLEEELRYQNRIFLKYITTKHPWVVMKSAMTLDGKIATRTGDSRWVTGEEARHRVHEMRSSLMAILVGIGTVEADDPMLNCRLEGEHRQPIRIVADTSARISLQSQLVRTALDQRTIVAHTAKAEKSRLEALHKAGVETWCCAEEEGHLSMADLMQKIGATGIDSVLVEGGGEVNYSLLAAGLVDEVVCFVAPKLVGGAESKSPIGGRGIERMAEAVELEGLEVEHFGEDLMIHGLIKRA